MTGRWFSPGTAVSSINKTDHYDKNEILLKVALSTIKQTKHIETNRVSGLLFSKELTTTEVDADV